MTSPPAQRPDGVPPTPGRGGPGAGRGRERDLSPEYEVGPDRGPTGSGPGSGRAREAAAAGHEDGPERGTTSPEEEPEPERGASFPEREGGGRGPGDVGDPRAADVVARLRGAVPSGRLGVAFSGGVDSSVLLALAVRALGADRVLGVLAVSPSLAQDERRAAHDVAATIGASVVEVHTHEGDDPDYRRNGPDRCYFCKAEMFRVIDAELVRSHQLAAVAYGENADDARRPDRPGSRAATEHAVLRPLADAGMDKASVRRVARVLGLPSAEKPASPCLASRIPHHEEVTPEKLAQIDAAESELRRLGLTDVRVRHHGDVARLEVPPAEIALLVSEPLREELLRAVRSAGFRFVAVDLAGIQSGAFTLPLVGMNGA